MQQQPLVSILMTCYNREQFITEAIESVLKLAYTNFELIIVDDGSKDNTVTIARSFAARDERIQVHVNKENLGDYPNRNHAASFAKGDYIFFVDSDDTIYPDTITKVMGQMLEQPHIGFGMTCSIDFPQLQLSSKEAIRIHLFKRQFLYKGPGGTVIKRDFFNAIGKYPEKYGPANDMYFNLKAPCCTNMLLFPFDFGFYRLHDGQQLNNRFSYMYNNYRYMRDAIEELPLPVTEEEKKWLIKKNKRRFSVHLVKFFCKTLSFSKTKEAYRKANFSFRFFLQGIFQSSN